MVVRVVIIIVMYRPSNERYAGEGNQMSAMGSYPPLPSIPKMHSFDYNSPPPLYYDPSQAYDYPPPNTNPPAEQYDARYGNWR